MRLAQRERKRDRERRRETEQSEREINKDKDAADGHDNVDDGDDEDNTLLNRDNDLDANRLFHGSVPSDIQTRCSNNVLGNQRK